MARDRIRYDGKEQHTAPHLNAGPKTFNNHKGFERGLWQRKTGWFELVPKTSVCGTILRTHYRPLAAFLYDDPSLKHRLAGAPYREIKGWLDCSCVRLALIISFIVSS